MVFADSHTHITFPDFDAEQDAVVHRAHGAGVKYLHLISTKWADVPVITQLAERHDGVRISVGVHPHNVDKENTSIEAVVRAAAGDHVVGIGETGLDFHYDYGSREKQEEAFRNHIRAAKICQLPLVLHIREADREAIRILEEEEAAEVGGVLHCFTGTPELAEWGINNGFYISFSGILTFKTGEPLRQIAQNLPLDRILIETDAPYLAPIPYRGKRNEPAYVVEIAKTLAEVRGVSLEEIGRLTTKNYLRLFKADKQLSALSDDAVLAYPIGESLYLNVTHGCTLKCSFCPKWTAPKVHVYDLTLEKNPTAAELIAAMGDLENYDEVVFCGYGEPTLRLKVLLEVAAEVKRIGGDGKKVRINTDGLANLVYGEDVTPQLAGLVDSVSISLNAQDQEIYDRHCLPSLAGSYQAVLDFTRLVKAHVPDVTLTALEGLEGVDIDACRQIAEGLGVKFRARFLNTLG